MNLEYVYTYMQSNLLEVPVYFAFYRARGLSLTQTLVLVTLANSITHPLVFFGFMGSGWTILTSIVLAEIFAIVAEACLDWQFARIDFKWAFVAAVAANFISWQLSPILTYLVFFMNR